MLNEEDRAAGLLLNLTGRTAKGKTSGALGMTVRALGWGWRVAVVQFMKGDRETGERSFFRTHFPEMIFEQYGLGLLSRPGDHAGMAQRGWARARELLAEFPGELLVLDELNNALTHGLRRPRRSTRCAETPPGGAECDRNRAVCAAGAGRTLRPRLRNPRGQAPLPARHPGAERIGLLMEHRLLWDLTGPEIEAESFRRIDAEASPEQRRASPPPNGMSRGGWCTPPPTSAFSTF